MTYRDAFGVVGPPSVSTDGLECNALLIWAANTRLYSGPVNVRWFGAGLGLGSDLARITSALVILTATGGELFFPAANYFLLGPIDITSNNITLRCESVSPCNASLEEFFDGRTDTSLNPQLSTRMHGHLCGAKNEAAIVRSSSGVRCTIVAVSFADNQ